MERDDYSDSTSNDNFTVTNLHSSSSSANQDLDLQEKTEFYFFFSGSESLIHLTLGLKNITKLVVIGQPIEYIEGLDQFEQLKELWIAECSIKKIENLENCKNLEKLYLYSNCISQIEGLDDLKKLHTLWLSGNRISTIKNIHQLEELKELYLCQNDIKRIGTSLLFNKNLKTLNLSGNPLCNLNDILHLPKVENLKFSDPVFKPCPIACLCNYRSLIVHQLENLKFLDSFEVDKDERAKTLDYIRRKIIYYDMIQHQLNYKYYNELHKKEKDGHLTMNKYKDSLYYLKVEELQYHENSSISSEDQNIMKVRANQDFTGYQIKNWLLQESQEKFLMAQKHRIHASQINMELLYGGNIKFKKYPIEYKRSNSFQILMNSFNCPDIFDDLGISSVKVSDVTEVINKGIQCMHHYLRKNMTSKLISWKYYLLSQFYGAKGIDTWPFSIIEHGFINVQETSVNVTDCIALSDYDWLTNIKKKCDTSFGYHGLNINERRTAILVKTPNENLSPVSQKEGYLCHKMEKRCFNCCNTFKVKCTDLLCPVLVIEYEYIFKDCFAIKKQELYSAHESYHSHKNMRKEITKMDILNTDTLPLKIPEDLWGSITKLSLQACGIKTIGKLPCLPNVSSINLSYNKLSSLGGLESFPNIADFDASFNNICTVADMATLKNLKRLDISWNYLGNALSILRTLKRCSPYLIHLEMSFNPIDDVKDLNHIICFARDYLPRINQFNENSVKTDLKVIKSVSQMGRRINQEFVNVQCNKSCLTTMWKCDQLYHSLACTESLTLQNSNDTICTVWKNQGIHSIECPEELDKLKWANFDDNFISNIEFLHKCLFLEELSMSRNILKFIDKTLLNHHRLVKLDLSNNYISSISSLLKSYLPLLEIFNISNNQISSLSGIEACPALTELYSYHNLIETLNDLNAIKGCINLLVVDLSSNKVEMADDFKTFVLFHLPMIEVINGRCVNKSDIPDAKLVFGCCLDQDYLIRQNKLADANFITELTMINCSFKKINLKASTLPNLVSLDLSNNKITRLWGLHDLPKLQTLCLSHNQVAYFTTDKEILKWLTARNKVLEIHPLSPNQHNKSIDGAIFSELRTLYLNNNGINSLIPLCLERIQNLHSLFLQGNELSCVRGIRPAEKLRHLILDGNRIELIDEGEMTKLSNLEDLYLENNRIKDLSFIRSLRSLQRLFLSQNRINENEQLRHLENLKHLEEITLHGNPLFRNTNNYYSVVQYSPLINRIDGHFLNLENCDKQEKET